MEHEPHIPGTAMDAIRKKMQSLKGETEGLASPVLACSTADGQTIYLTLDTGATTSLISLNKANALNLKISKSTNTAVQVDGQSNLHVIGEVNTVFYRGSTELVFRALVVANLGTDILAGTNFIVTNDVTCSQSKGASHIPHWKLNV